MSPASRPSWNPKVLALVRCVPAAVFLGVFASSAPAQTAAPADDARNKLVDYFSENFSVIEKVLELYRARFVAAAPIFEAAGVELPASLGGTAKPDEAASAPHKAVAPVRPQPTPAVRRSPFKEVHIETSGPLDPTAVLPSTPPVSSPTREDIARRAAYERANIEAYYFYKAMRERQQPAR